jgi:hypothetical protein
VAAAARRFARNFNYFIVGGVNDGRPAQATRLPSD